jgi:hypothetical protein
MTLATTTLSHALAECLDCLREGESISACLDRYPEHRSSLRPLLEVAKLLQEHQPAAAPSPFFIVSLKAKLEKANNKRKGGEADRKRQ